MFVMAAFAVFAYFISTAINSIIAHTSARSWGDMVLFFVIILTAIILIIRMLRPVIHPDTLTLSLVGWTETRFGQASTYKWSDFGTVTKKVISRGKGGTSTYVRLEPKEDGGKAVLIRGSDYTYPFDVVLNAVQKAKAGRLTMLEPIRTSLASALSVTTAIALVYLALGLYGWHSLHRSAPTREARVANDSDRLAQLQP